MPNHTYQPGDRVERISTGEIAPFSEIVESSFGNFISTQPTCGLEEIMGAKAEPHWWPASDCRPAVDNAAELAAKDAEIARLEAENEALRCHHSDADRALSEWHRQEQRIAELEAEVAAEKDAYHKLANEAQEKYTKLYATERENAKLRKLCGEAAKFFINTECGHFECHKCKHLHNCGLVEGEMVRKLRAAAEGGE
jgi:hypothetical protein